MSDSNSFQWRYVLAGFLILGAGAYFDCVRGPLMPVLNQSLSLSYQHTSVFLVLSYIAGIISTLCLIPALNRYSERTVSLVLSLIGIATALIGLTVQNYLGLLGLAVLLGITTATVGTLCNILVIKGTPASTRTRWLCGLHIMYAASALLSPTMVSFSLSRGIEWTWVLGGVPCLFLLIVVLSLLSIRSNSSHGPPIPQSTKLNRMQMLIILAFATYVAGEVLISMWMVPYLVDHKQLLKSEANLYLIGFFATMCASRFLCFLSLKPRQEKNVIRASVMAACLFFIMGHMGFLWAFSLTGILGPYFPLVLSRISHRFPEQWRSMTVFILVSMQISIGLIHFVVGRLFEKVGIGFAYTGPVILLAVALVLISLYFEWEKRLQKV